MKTSPETMRGKRHLEKELNEKKVEIKIKKQSIPMSIVFILATPF